MDSCVLRPGLPAGLISLHAHSCRRQIQLNSEHGLPVAKVVKSIVDEEGVRGLYRGFLPNAIKNLPNKGRRAVPGGVFGFSGLSSGQQCTV